MSIGRPTKYGTEILQKAESYLDDSIADDKIPFVEELALLLDVNDDTLVEWGKKHEDFSATLERLKTHQKLCLFKGGLEKRYHANFAMFLLKANHGMDDKQPEQNTVVGGFIYVPEKRPEGHGAIQV